MNKHLKQYQAALKRIDDGLAKHTIALEDIEAIFTSLTGYIATLEKKIIRMEKAKKASAPKKSSSTRTKVKPRNKASR